jgi:class 3 adenylate cyclase
MRRSLAATLIIGVIVAGIIAGLHAAGMLLRLEWLVQQLVSHYRATTKLVPGLWQYVFITLLSLGVAGLTVMSSRRGWTGWLVLALCIELVGLCWVCALYKLFFQPVPSILAVALAFVAADRFAAIAGSTRSNRARSLFNGRWSSDQIRRVIAGEIPLDTKARSCEAAVIVCDIANKYALARESEPAAFAETTEKFIRRMTESLLEAGGYIEAADGEGVVAVFGFPKGNAEHADKAVRVALDLVQSFRDSGRGNNGEVSGNCDVHIGVSSGAMIVAPLQDAEHPRLLTSGEAVELARRFCAANRRYGSRILICPRTFELASKAIVARPIDFLNGVNVHERHEVYEPLWLASEAKPEHIARRDSFWNGVVLYREKRWAEAYTEFQKARGPDAEEDAPLQFYLRRVEPLALRLMDVPSD